MIGFLLRRVLLAAVTLVAVLTLVFVVVRILPGDPALVVLGDQASAAGIAALHAKLGLDQPLIAQYGRFLGGALLGRFGNSLVTGRPVLGEVLSVLPYTAELTAVATVLGVLIGVPAGVWSATHRNRWPDTVTRIASLAGLSAPAFVSGIVMLLLFAIQWRWFPVISAGQDASLAGRLRDLALPALNLALIMAAYLARVSRSAMLEVLGQDYVRTARAKGVPPRPVIWRHALRNALIPVVTVTGLYVGILIGNSVLTEIVFNRPGLGKLIVGALAQRDYTMLQGMIVIYTAVVVAVNLLTDLTYGLIDPRVQYR